MSVGNRAFGTFFVGILVSILSLAVSAGPVSVQEVGIRSQAYRPRALNGMLANISRGDTLPGFVVASPSKTDPDYYFHWVRDAALVMGTVLDEALASTNKSEKEILFRYLFDYATFSRRNQLTPTLSPGFGEPKFVTDGSGYAGDWGRPQNDGPALRALTLIRFARELLKDPVNGDYVRNFLFDSRLPTESVIKADLEFVAHNWQAASFDLWEEVKGNHFYTNMVQRASLIEGAKFAELMGDRGAAAYYRDQAHLLEARLMSYWDPNSSFIRATMNRTGGADYKNSNIDIAVVLGVLHGNTIDGFFASSDPEVLSTIVRIENAFRNLYTINQNGQPGIAIGRYPEDRYDGLTSITVGNPWFICTQALAEAYYSIAKNWTESGEIIVNVNSLSFLKGLRSGENLNQIKNEMVTSKDSAFVPLVEAARRRGDEYLARSFSHMNQDTGSMAEQFNRYTGHMQGARDLTWSYASFLSAIGARDR